MGRRSAAVAAAAMALAATTAQVPASAVDVEPSGGGVAATVPATCVPDVSTIEKSGNDLVADPLRDGILAIADDGGMSFDLPISVAVPPTVAPGEAFHATIGSSLPLGTLAGFIEDDVIEPQLPGGVSVSQFQMILGDRDPRATLHQSAPAGTTIDVGSFVLTSTQPPGEPPLIPTVDEQGVDIAIGDFDSVGVSFKHPTPGRTGYILDRTEPQWTATVDVDVWSDPGGTPGTMIDLLPGTVEFNLGLRLQVQVSTLKLSGRVHADWACTPDAPDAPVGQIEYVSPAVGLQVEKVADRAALLAGDPAGWTITVRNTGTTELTGVVLGDAAEPTCDTAIGTMDALSSVEVTCSTDTTGLSGDLLNEAVVGSDQTGAASDADSASVTIAGCAPPGPFPDVAVDHPFCTHIAWLVAQGIASGYADGGFHPASPISRQAMAAFLYRLAGSPDGLDPVCGAAPFPDVAVDHPFCGPIAWLVAEGIASGYADGGFHPASPITRQAMAAFLYRLAGSPDGLDPVCGAAPFPDVAVDHPFCGPIAWLVAQAIASGYADGGYHPVDDVSRQAMAAFLARLAPLL